MPDKPNVLFLCTGNACRSQMAEGFAKALKSDRFHAYSAGVDPHGMNPRAMAVMKEAGVDLSSHSSKHVDTLRHIRFDYVITVCGNADQACPPWLREGKVIHHGFDDPPALARALGPHASEDQILAEYRKVRDQIRAWVETLPDSLEDHP